MSLSYKLLTPKIKKFLTTANLMSVTERLNYYCLYILRLRKYIEYVVKSRLMVYFIIRWFTVLI